jgi:hypothetical protein
MIRNIQQPNPNTEDFLTPGSFIRAARAAHPAFRYGIATAGVLAIVVVFVRFGVGLATLAFGAIALIALMVLFLVFAQASKLTKAHLDRPARVLVWAILIIVIVIVLLLVGSVFFNRPLPFRDWIVAQLVKPPRPVNPGPDPGPSPKPEPPDPWVLIHVTKNVPVTLLSNGTISAIYEDLGDSATLSIQTPQDVFPSINVDVNGNGVLDPGLDTYYSMMQAGHPATDTYWGQVLTRNAGSLLPREA